MLRAALVAGFVLHRLVTPASAAWALAGGCLAGGAALGVPAASLAGAVLSVLVAVFAAVLVLPQAARLPTAERAGGYEQLLSVRPLSSTAWALGRLGGTLAGSALLVALLAGSALLVAGSRPVPRELQGVVVGGLPGTPLWRFLPPQTGAQALELRVDVIPVRVTGAELHVEVQRGEDRRVLTRPVRSERVVSVPLEGLPPGQGAVFASFHPGPGLVLGARPPRLRAGSVPLARGVRPLSRGAAATLALALIAAAAAGCLFHFETACLAGVLALAVALPEKGWVLAALLVLLVAMSVMGTALVRRQALP